MIISSQDKELIVDTTGLVIEINRTNHSIIAHPASDLISDHYMTLGRYSSHERAKQVLGALCLEARTCRTFFQMPQEED